MKTNLRQGNRGGFSLVEVVLALGVAAFCILTIVALLPAGMHSTHDSIAESEALNVLSGIIADRKASPLTSKSTIYQLPKLDSTLTSSTTMTFGILENNQPTPTMGGARYRVDCTFTPPLPGTANPYTGYFKVSWPAASPTVTGSVELVVTFPQS